MAILNVDPKIVFSVIIEADTRCPRELPSVRHFPRIAKLTLTYHEVAKRRGILLTAY